MGIAMRVALMILCIFSCATVLRGADPKIDFAADVLPIFKKHCYECHDADKQTASFRLDVRRIALEGGESGAAAIVPGKPGESELLKRVGTDDIFTQMPPEGPRLTAAEIRILTLWIEQGTDWPDKFAGQDPREVEHWAFEKPVRPDLPDVANAGHVRNAIDRFVIARLESEGVTLAPEADKATLIRRLTLDLTGLPPTPAELDAFLADESPDAYRTVVERLLASPHYGERWGRVWLDAARYADSDGYEKDKPRFAYFYRDYVINSLNNDLPYDQFIIEQIAGDLLPNPTQDQIVATGFLRNSMINEEGGIDPEQFRMEAMFDRTDAIGKSILGLTIQCAQCHDHKFDPISQKEYYELFAFINNCHEANVTVYTDQQRQKRQLIFREIESLESELKAALPDWSDRLAAWREQVRGDQPEWSVVAPELDDSGGQKHDVLEDGSIRASGYSPSKATTSFTITTPLKKISAVQLELLNDPRLPRGGPGRSLYGLCALTEFKVTAAPADGSAKAKSVKIISATADVNPPKTELKPIFHDKSDKKRVTGPAIFAIDGDNNTAWGLDIGPGRSNVPRKAVFVLETPVEFESGVKLTFQLVQNHGGWNSNDNQTNNLGRFRFAITEEESAVADPLPAEVRRIVETVPAEDQTEQQTAKLFSYWRTTVPEFADINGKIEALWKTHPEGTSQLVLAEREKVRPTHLLERGSFTNPAELVQPGVPEFLHDLKMDGPPTRLDFARWLASPESPTTARSIVNRVWQQYFGIGLVETPADLGTQSPAPSHPALLDWLAVEFMENSWRLKELHRQIVLSATYRQSSHVGPELLARDPYNRLLARGARFRMEAAAIRDIALAASGLLNREVGGPSVYPPMPKYLLEPPVSYGFKTWPTATGSDRYRRAIYTFRFRTVPYPMLDAFDAPPGNTSCVRRSRSNTPLQALVTLNEPIFMQCARALAALTVNAGLDSNEERLDLAFRRTLARYPTKAEQAELLGLFESQRKRFAGGKADPWTLAAADPKHPPELPEGTEPAELAAWTAVCRVLLNLDETITRE